METIRMLRTIPIYFKKPFFFLWAYTVKNMLSIKKITPMMANNMSEYAPFGNAAFYFNIKPGLGFAAGKPKGG
ncbi:hypothetical protein ABD67_03245 [Bacillus sonorensis]|uniref:Uncharacterized protein n=2 Tax=Bacillus sonorensis TaxID=119858 RepID=M5P802_9BACI|nr:hypothetical protein S101395_00989 [Bacillus sonorensis]EME75573.1 hypothetical protein BSONL12_07078 [Bacillus sonorensis L12]MBG9913926.1 hypothetical protein [Bacillus sonorensis]NWN80131.1 hypothetical protein [Bacillus sp. (in: firmicutes)]GIN68740.1 hypothetical protein J41TS2_41610 [Bacillus sonorensis]